MSQFFVHVQEVNKLGRDNFNRFREYVEKNHNAIADPFYGQFDDRTNWSSILITSGGVIAWSHTSQPNTHETPLTAEQIIAMISTQFDFQTSDWYIKVNNELEWKAACKWLEQHGVKCSTRYNDFRSKFLASTVHTTESGARIADLFAHATSLDPNAREIKLTFETTLMVTEVEYPKETIELNGKVYLKSDVESALAKLVPLGDVK